MKHESGYSPAGRMAVLLVGTVLGGLCYLLGRHYLFTVQTDDNLWLLGIIMMAVPATVMVASTLSSSRQSLHLRLITLVVLWGLLALLGIAAARQDTFSGLEVWERREWFLTFSVELMLIGLLLLPWLQWCFEPSEGQTFYTVFYRRYGNNVMTLLVVMMASGLLWLILLLWAKLFEMVNISLFYKVFLILAGSFHW